MSASNTLLFCIACFVSGTLSTGHGVLLFNAHYFIRVRGRNATAEPEGRCRLGCEGAVKLQELWFTMCEDDLHLVLQPFKVGEALWKKSACLVGRPFKHVTMKYSGRVWHINNRVKVKI